jgi:F0F1-type ATP synthase assembly protein I
VDQLKVRQELYSGVGDGFGRAFEFVMTPVLFGAIGWLIDRALGTTPVFILLLTVFCLIGVGTKMYYRYKADMEAQETGAPWAKTRRSVAPGSMQERQATTGTTDKQPPT